MTIELPKYVLYCLKQLENSGFEAWCVGGAVRDHIMGKQPFDYDITTNATPQEIISVFPKTVPTGIEHGTVTAVTDNGNVEITTYRSDGEYSDHRSPDSVIFVKTIEKDLKRRDFTMNAVCYNPNKGFYDPENGISDIKGRFIRAIGAPDKRFTEDALRIMRAFRFSAQLGFSIEENTLKSALKLSDTLQSISVERIYSELTRAVSSEFPQELSSLLNCGAFEFLGLPKHTVPDVIKRLPYSFPLRFAVIFKSSYCNSTTVLHNLKADNETIRNTQIFGALLNAPIPQTKTDLKRMLMISSIEKVREILKYYDITGFNTNQLEDMLTEILENKEAYCLKMLKLDGNALMKIGLSGKAVGDTLKHLLEHVIENPQDNTEEALLKEIK